MKKILIFFLVSVYLFILMIPQTNAVECGWGTIETKFKLYNKDWQDTGVTDVPICTYEPFQLRADVKTKKECEVSLSICGVSIKEAYEVIEGPSEFEDWSNDIDCYPGWNSTFIWTLRPNEEWAGGSAPVLLYVQFTSFNPKAELSERVKYHVEKINMVHCQISTKIWGRYKINNNPEVTKYGDNEQLKIKSISGFKLILILTSSLVINLLNKKSSR